MFIRSCHCKFTHLSVKKKTATLFKLFVYCEFKYCNSYKPFFLIKVFVWYPGKPAESEVVTKANWPTNDLFFSFLFLFFYSLADNLSVSSHHGVALRSGSQRVSSVPFPALSGRKSKMFFTLFSPTTWTLLAIVFTLLLLWVFCEGNKWVSSFVISCDSYLFIITDVISISAFLLFL